MVNRVLMVAYHFPPLHGSSGILRTLMFSKYLPEFGWEPLILTTHPRAYPQVANDQLGDAVQGRIVRRAFALDTGRHLAIGGRYPGLLAVPDRIVSWVLGAVPAGLAMVRKYRPQVLWSTYPIATAHLIGYLLHRITGLPWVADFRDPMAQDGYPSQPITWRAFKWIEEAVLRRARRSVFTTPGTLRFYLDRYENLPREALRVISNGYDEDSFAAAERTAGARRSSGGPLVLVHSGTVYPSERDPSHLFQALGDMRRAGEVCASDLQLVLRASGHEAYLGELIRGQGIEDLVSLPTSINYGAALGEMLQADALLLLQASNCNDQVPAKLYEYFRTRRPILALTDRAGDTAQTLVAAGVDSILPLDDAAQIRVGLSTYLHRLRAGQAPIASESAINSSSRRGGTAALANILQEVT